MGKRFEGSRRIDGPRGAIVEAARIALRELGTTPYLVDPLNGRIGAFTGLSLASYGEKVEILVLDGEVRVSSECQMAMTVVDWGRNKKNVTALLDHIERILPHVTMNYGLVPPIPMPASTVAPPPVVVARPTPPPPPPPVPGSVPPPVAPRAVPGGDPMSLLHARYLRGELTLDEFERLQAEILPKEL